MTWPIRLRLAVWFAALLTTTLVAFGAFLVIQLRTDLHQDMDRELRTSSATIVEAIADDGDETPAHTGKDLADDFRETTGVVLPDKGAAAQVLSADGEVLFRRGVPGAEVLVSPEALSSGHIHEPRTITVPVDGRPQHFRRLVVDVPTAGPPRYLVVALSLEGIEHDVRELLLLLLLGGPVAVVATALAGYWVAHRALHPLDRMTSDAQAIRTDRLHERVAVPAARDELRRLAETLNAMLDRIEEASKQQRQLIADTSHELRTPLTVMRTELDVSLRADELSPAARETLGSAREEVDQMSRTVDNLLTLAAVDEGRLELLTETMDLRQAAEEAAAPLRYLAHVKDVRLEISGDSHEVRADHQRLRLALSNLIENAIKYTGHGGGVRVQTWERAGEVGVTVTDNGPGVSAEDSRHLFDRFYRVGGGGSGGSGLGLAICREVAEAHGGRVWLDSELGRGSAFSLALPSWRALPTEDRVATPMPVKGNPVPVKR